MGNIATRVIKTVRQQDIARLVPLFVSVFAEPPYNEFWSPALAHKRLTEIWKEGKGFCLAAVQDDQVVGLLFCRKQTWQDGVHLIIEDTSVDKKYRQQGVGRHLVEHLEEIARKKKIASIDLLSNTRSHTLTFWQHLGFKENGYIQFMKRL